MVMLFLMPMFQSWNYGCAYDPRFVYVTTDKISVMGGGQAVGVLTELQK